MLSDFQKSNGSRRHQSLCWGLEVSRVFSRVFSVYASCWRWRSCSGNLTESIFLTSVTQQLSLCCLLTFCPLDSDIRLCTANLSVSLSIWTWIWLLMWVKVWVTCKTLELGTGQDQTGGEILLFLRTCYLHTAEIFFSVKIRMFSWSSLLPYTLHISSVSIIVCYYTNILLVLV